MHLIINIFYSNIVKIMKDN